MAFYHTKCGGNISILRGKCIKCGKRWNPISFLFNTEMMPVPRKEKTKSKKVSTRKPTSYAQWADKWHGVPTIASRLPNWPRWARALTGLIFFGGIVFLIVWFIIL